MNSIKFEILSARFFKCKLHYSLGISEDQIKPFEQALIERSAGTLKLEEMN